MHEVPVRVSEDPFHFDHEHHEVSQCEKVLLHVALVGDRRVSAVHAHRLHQLLLHGERHGAVAVHCAFLFKSGWHRGKAVNLQQHRQCGENLQNYILGVHKIVCELDRISPLTLYEAPQRARSVRGSIQGVCLAQQIHGAT